MISINIFKVAGDSDSLESAYNWPDQPIPAGRLIGKQGNALLMQLAEKDKVAVISAPIGDVVFKDNGLPIVDIQWAFE